MAIFKIIDVDGSKTELELPVGYNLSEQRRTTEGTSITLEYAGRSLVLRERGKGSIEAEGDHTHRSKTKRTGAYTMADAIEWAVKELHRVVTTAGVDLNHPSAEAINANGGYPTLIQARNLAYKRRVWAHTSVDQQDKYKRFLDILLTVFGPEKSLGPWDQSDIDLLFAIRCGTTRGGRQLTEQELAQFGIKKPGIRFPQIYGRRNLRPAKPITCKLQLRDLKVLFRYLMAQNVDGKRFLLHNPLDGLDFGNAIRGTRADYHKDRYRWLLAAADIADPTGQLRLLVVLVFLTGHRIQACLKLKLEHLGFTTRGVRALLRQVRRTHESEPVASETWASSWVHGAIYWILENDKEGFDRVTPMSSIIRREFDRYLGRRAALLGGAESPFLFPREADPSRALDDSVSRDLLRASEAIARPAIEAAGLDSDEIMPETPDDAWHPGRGWWEARHAELGWTGNRNSAYVGGWTCNSGAVQSTVYGELDPGLMLACVEGLSYAEAAEALGLIEGAKAAMNPEEPIIEHEELAVAA